MVSNSSVVGKGVSSRKSCGSCIRIVVCCLFVVDDI